MEESRELRTVYDFPIAGHQCIDGKVIHVKMVRRHGSPEIEGMCRQCGTVFQYRRPKPSNVRHEDGGVTHF